MICFLGTFLSEEDFLFREYVFGFFETCYFKNEAEKQENIQNKLPYISKAVITRRLPSSVIIEIESTDAVFCFNTGSGYALTDADGKVLEADFITVFRKRAPALCRG